MATRSSGRTTKRGHPSTTTSADGQSREKQLRVAASEAPASSASPPVAAAAPLPTVAVKSEKKKKEEEEAEVEWYRYETILDQQFWEAMPQVPAPASADTGDAATARVIRNAMDYIWGELLYVPDNLIGILTVGAPGDLLFHGTKSDIPADAHMHPNTFFTPSIKKPMEYISDYGSLIVHRVRDLGRPLKLLNFMAHAGVGRCDPFNRMCAYLQRHHGLIDDHYHRARGLARILGAAYKGVADGFVYSTDMEIVLFDPPAVLDGPLRDHPMAINRGAFSDAEERKLVGVKLYDGMFQVFKEAADAFVAALPRTKPELERWVAQNAARIGELRRVARSILEPVLVMQPDLVSPLVAALNRGRFEEKKDDDGDGKHSALRDHWRVVARRQTNETASRDTERWQARDVKAPFVYPRSELHLSLTLTDAFRSLLRDGDRLWCGWDANVGPSFEHFSSVRHAVATHLARFGLVPDAHSLDLAWHITDRHGARLFGHDSRF